MYKPLPKKLTIRNSEIEGLGLFSEIKISKNSFIGVSHIKNDLFPNNYIRTPLGGFINHSDEPNCVKIKEGDRYNLFTLRDIKAEEEITLKYTFYKIW